jgi:hypothetical protein
MHIIFEYYTMSQIVRHLTMHLPRHIRRVHYYNNRNQWPNSSRLATTSTKDRIFGWDNRVINGGISTSNCHILAPSAEYTYTIPL